MRRLRAYGKCASGKCGICRKCASSRKVCRRRLRGCRKCSRVAGHDYGFRYAEVFLCSSWRGGGGCAVQQAGWTPDYRFRDGKFHEDAGAD